MTQDLLSASSQPVASPLVNQAMAGGFPKLDASFDTSTENGGGREKGRKWPTLYTLLFIGLTCGAFWLAASFGLLRVL